MRPEARHSLVMVGGTGATALIGMVYAVHVGRRLGPEAYADFSAALALAALCYVALGPINGTVTRFTAEFAARGERGRIFTLHREVFRRVLTYGAVALLVAAALSWPLADLLHFRSVPLLLAVWGMVYLTLLINVDRGVLRGAQEFGQHNISTIIEASIRLLAGVLLLLVRVSALAALGGYLLSLATVVGVDRWQLRRVFGVGPPQDVDGAAVRRFTLPMFLLMSTTAGFLYVDMLFVKRVFPDVAAGWYGAAVTLAGALAVLVNPFHTLLLPLLTAMHEQNRRLAGTVLRVCGYLLLMASGPILVFAIWSDTIVVRLYGVDFRPAAGLLLGIAGARLVAHLSGLIATVHVARNDFRFLGVYMPGLALQVVGLLLWHETLLSVVVVVLVAQLLTLAALLIHLAGRRVKAAERPAC